MVLQLDAAQCILIRALLSEGRIMPSSVTVFRAMTGFNIIELVTTYSVYLRFSVSYGPSIQSDFVQGTHGNTDTQLNVSPFIVSLTVRARSSIPRVMWTHRPDWASASIAETQNLGSVFTEYVYG